MNCVSWQDCFVTFIRKGKTRDKALFVVANFSGVDKNMTAGVPWAGKYKEILNTDALKYAGNGFVNPRVKTAKKLNWDGQPYCINLHIAAQSVAIFEFSAKSAEAAEEKKGTYTKKAVPKKKKK